MNKLALNFICKNEAHVIERMLETAVKITDLIVVNDTGSTDGTQDIIKKFGEKYNIPIYIFERNFDNFENSRNYALEKLLEVVNQLGWELNNTWGYWFDCDEKLEISNTFNKNSLNKDFYMINAIINGMKYPRNTLFRLSKKFRWYGPVHEYLVCDDKPIISDHLLDLKVNVLFDGDSWKQDTAIKYLNHAHILEKYLHTDRSDPRWIFFTAQSYHDSHKCKFPTDKSERLRRALYYYKERVSRNDGYHEERFYSQLKIGTVMYMLEEPWVDVKRELLKAYAMDNLRAEPLKLIVEHYLNSSNWNMAYLYSKSLKILYHDKTPAPKRKLFIDESLYKWRILESHATASYYVDRKDEAKACYIELLNILENEPNYFSEDDVKKIKTNYKFFVK